LLAKLLLYVCLLTAPKENMPDPNFDSGHPHVVLNVKTVDGPIHSVAVPESTSLDDLHAALSADPAYLHEFPTPTPQPTAAGALENSDDFRNQSKAAWDAIHQGANANAESGFSVYKDGTGSSIHTEVHPQTSGMTAVPHDTIHYAKDDFAVVHSHPNATSDKPSGNDVEAAKKISKPVYVTSRSGLWEVRPSDGKVLQVFKSPTWFSDKQSK
jgi:hypothetical protein